MEINLTQFTEDLKDHITKFYIGDGLEIIGIVNPFTNVLDERNIPIEELLICGE